MSDKLEALKAKKPLDTKTREAEAAGYVTDDNSGGYYVVECQECGEVYPSQQCDGGGPIADTGDYNDALCPHCGCESPEECNDTPLVWNVQQAKINALLAALEEANKRAERLNGMLDNSMRATNAAEQREEHLKATVDVLSAKNAELEQRLQQPIKLPLAEGESKQEYLDKVIEVLNGAGLQIRYHCPRCNGLLDLTSRPDGDHYCHQQAKVEGE